MRDVVAGANLDHMAMMANGVERFVLQEFRLSKADTDGAVARIVGASPHGIEPPVPLLTSIADRRNVAMIRALHTDETRVPDAAQRAALEPFVSRWRAPTEYSPRISERSESPPSHYRLAVTESGINDAAADPMPSTEKHDAPSTHLGLLWIGQPVDTHAGLLILLGDDGPPEETRPAREWPLPLSSFLGVRIYEGGNTLA
jgi:hypothetical protein